MVNHGLSVELEVSEILLTHKEGRVVSQSDTRREDTFSWCLVGSGALASVRPSDAFYIPVTNQYDI